MSEIDDIRKDMAQIRLEMHRDVVDVVHEAESIFDWRSYIRNAPWVSVGAALAIGYLLVPRRRSRPVETYISQPSIPAQPVLDGPRQESSLNLSFWGIAGSVLSLAAPVAIRAAQSYAASWLEERLLNSPSFGTTATSSSESRTTARTPTEDLGANPRHGF